MDVQLIADLVKALMQGKSLATTALDAGDNRITVAELVALGRIANNREGSAENIYADDLQGSLFVSKPAISQMLKSLEARELIRREIDPNNRRKLIVTLTDQGRVLLDDAMERTREYLSRVIESFGVEKTREMIALYGEFTQIMVDVAREAHEATCQPQL